MLCSVRMPGYVIHLAVGKVYSQNNKIEDLQSFERGIIAPDMLGDKTISHYGPYSSQPGLNQFIQINGISNSYNEGYFLHLVTDYLFYHNFLRRWERAVYDDYDKLNSIIMQKYGITIPEEIREKVEFKDGKTTILNEEDLYKFINSVGKINIRQIVAKGETDFKNRLSQEIETEK